MGDTETQIKFYEPILLMVLNIKLGLIPIMQISDTEESKAVYGVFLPWDDADDGLDGNVNERMLQD